MQSIGALKNHAKKELQSMGSGANSDRPFGQEIVDRGSCNVSLSAAVARSTHGSRGFSFALLIDHTGCKSVCDKTEFIRKMAEQSLNVEENSSTLPSRYGHVPILFASTNFFEVI